jgi:hypothetical protein
MTMITDPDDLVDPTSIAIDTTGKTVQLLVAGLLSTDGVTIKCVYSKLKELWKTNTTYIKFPFPMGPITDEQFEMVNGWDWKDDTTRYLLRTGGWALKDSGGVSQEEWAGIVTLGSIGASDQAYFLQSAGGAVTNFQLTGPVNQAVKVYGDGTHGAFDYRSFFKVYCRIYAKSYAFSQLSDIGVSALTYQAYRFPLANATDIKVTHADSVVTSSLPYQSMSITWYAAAQPRSIGGVNRNFHVIVNANAGTAEQVYEYVDYELRLNSDIDAGSGTQIGKKVGSLLRFVGDTLYTISGSEGGVYIDNYQAADVNRLVFVDDTNAERIFPYTAVVTFNMGANLVADANAFYWCYYTAVPSGSYGTANAVLVTDNNGLPMTGSVAGSSSIQRTFSYDTNTDGGRASGSDAPITAVAIGLNTAQFVNGVTTIARSISNAAALVAPLERNYSNL